MRKIASLLSVLMLLCTLAFGQSRTVTGTITDENGTPIPFATITETGTNNATTADATGNYSITVKQNSRLTISSTGFQPQTIAPTGNELSLRLARGGNLQEVVVTSFGIRRTEKALGYSVSKVDPNAITQKSEPDMLKGLQGKVAGVDIRTSQGTPGAATRIQIRGNNSFFGNTQPLIIVDGVPYSNTQVSTSSQTSGGTAYSSGIANLDPNDIASMNVLKGSVASALYGSRASNGVILITTKSGSAARTRKGNEVTVSSSVSFEEIANLPDYQNLYGAGSNFGYSNSNGSWGPAFTSRDSIPAWPEYKAAYPELFPSANIKYRAYPNNVKDLFRTGQVYENSVGVNGGDEKSSASVTISQLSHKGYVENSSYNRYNIGLGGATKLSMGINVRGNFSYAKSIQKGGYFGEQQIAGASSLFARSLFLARNWDLNLPGEDKKGIPITPNGGGQFDNPRWAAKNNIATTEEERFVAGFHADYNVNNWLRLDYTGGTNVSLLDRDEVIEIGSRAAEGRGQLIVDNYHNQELSSNFIATLTPKIANDFTLRTVIGGDVNQRTTNREKYIGKIFITRGIYSLKNTSQQIFDNDSYSKRRILGAFAQATLGFRDYAFIDLTGRNDWSSTLPKESRSYFYPSVSGSFIFSEALKLPKNIIDYGKIRAGWAKVGRDADPYSLQDVFVIGTNFQGRSTGSISNTANNPDLKPEFTREFEVGTQLTFLKRRVDVDFAWYNRTSTNLIAPIATAATTGYGEYYTNFGKIANKGVELELTVRPIMSQSLNWSIRGVFTKNKNTVIELEEGVKNMALADLISGTISSYFEPGQPYGYLRGPVNDRDDEGNLLIDPTTGQLIVATEEAKIGDPNPEFKLGVTNSISYKGFFLNALFDMTKGGDMYSVTATSLLGRGVTNDTKDRTANWIIPGVYGDPNTHLPILVDGKKVQNQTRITTNDLYFGNTFAINGAEEWNVFDATVYRIREIAIGYEFPKSLVNKLKLGSASLSITGRNLWYLAPNFPKYTNFDPEVNSYGSTAIQGVELSAAPTTKRLGVNLKVTF